jgi:hypothetical protein
MNDDRRSKGAGGTSGGVAMFFAGCAMAVAGGYLLLNQIKVRTSLWQLWGYDTSGLTLVPFIVGVALLFIDGKSKLGWLLSGGALVAIVSGVLFNLSFYFAPTSLWNTLLIFVLLAGGVGLTIRSLQPS